MAARMQHHGVLQVVVALPQRHGLWIGSTTAEAVVRRAGGIPYPVGAGDPEQTLKWMRRFDFNLVMSSPSYMTILTRWAEEVGYHRRLDKILLGGERVTEEHRAYFESYWGATVFDSYGSTEMGGAQSISLPGCAGVYLNDLHLFTEIVDPDTDEPAKEGELIFTTLVREAMPLVRYRSGDRVRNVQCSEVLPFRAVQVLDRLDDMIVVGGVNLCASVIADSVHEAVDIESRMRILVDREDLTDLLTLAMETPEATVDIVRHALVEAYPEIEEAIGQGRLRLEVEAGVGLEGQIKGIAVVDRRP